MSAESNFEPANQWPLLAERHIAAKQWAAEVGGSGTLESAFLAGSLWCSMVAMRQQAPAVSGGTIAASELTKIADVFRAESHAPALNQGIAEYIRNEVFALMAKSLDELVKGIE